jgi:hypothetical protein
MIKFSEVFTEEEKAAIDQLLGRGFKAFAEAKMEDVRELDGKRRRTFRNEGRYDFVLALKKAAPLPASPTIEAPVLKPVDEMTVPELQAEVKKPAGVSKMKKPELQALVQAQRREREVLFRSYREK